MRTFLFLSSCAIVNAQRRFNRDKQLLEVDASLWILQVRALFAARVLLSCSISKTLAPSKRFHGSCGGRRLRAGASVVMRRNRKSAGCTHLRNRFFHLCNCEIGAKTLPVVIHPTLNVARHQMDIYELTNKRARN